MASTSTVPETTTSKAAQQAAGLRRIADLIEANPELAGWFDHILTGPHGGIDIFPRGKDYRAALAWFVRTAKAAGATITKDISDKLYNVEASFGGVKVKALSSRGEVCERVVVGTETVTRMVPDPAAELVEVTETVDVVEWVCAPLLAEQVSA